MLRPIPDIAVIDKNQKSPPVINIPIAIKMNVREKEYEELEKY